MPDDRVVRRVDGKERHPDMFDHFVAGRPHVVAVGVLEGERRVASSNGGEDIIEFLQGWILQFDGFLGGFGDDVIRV